MTTLKNQRIHALSDHYGANIPYFVVDGIAKKQHHQHLYAAEHHQHLYAAEYQQRASVLRAISSFFIP